MLKKSLFSPARPRRATTRLFPCGVLALLRGSTYGTEPPGGRNYSRGFSVRQDSFKGRTAHTMCGTYLLASSLATAFLSILRWFPRSLLVVRDPFLTVRLVQVIED